MRLATVLLRRPARTLSAGLLGTALLAGCGGAAAPEATDRLSPAEAVQAAATTTEQAGSSRFSLESTAAVAGQEVTFSGEGLTDPAARTGSSTFTLPGGMGTIEQRFLGDELFLQVPGQPGWFRLALSDLVGTALESAASPTGSLDALEGVSDVEEVGEEDVRGEPTTRYTGTVDARAGLEQVGGALGEVADEALAAAGTDRFPVEAWLDDDGRLRRFRIVLDLPASEATGGQPVSSTTTVELFDFGVDVAVEPPPADQVQDGAPLLEALRGAGG